MVPRIICRGDDSDSVELGNAIRQAVANTQDGAAPAPPNDAETLVFIVLIRPGWQTDYVADAVEHALRFGRRILPILVDDAEMPKETDLPPRLRGLLSWQAVRASRTEGAGWDTSKLIQTVGELLRESQTESTEWADKGLKDTSPVGHSLLRLLFMIMLAPLPPLVGMVIGFLVWLIVCFFAMVLPGPDHPVIHEGNAPTMIANCGDGVMNLFNGTNNSFILSELPFYLWLGRIGGVIFDAFIAPYAIAFVLIAICRPTRLPLPTDQSWRARFYRWIDRR